MGLGVEYQKQIGAVAQCEENNGDEEDMKPPGERLLLDFGRFRPR